MRFHIQHSTQYHYTAPVFLEPQRLHVHPRFEPEQTVHRFQLTIDPEPAGVSARLDVDGNALHCAWFNGQTEQLSVAIQAEIETHRVNPFAFFVDSGAAMLPLNPSHFPSPTAASSYLQRPFATDDLIAKWVEDIVEASNGETVAFLANLNRTINERCEQVHREVGEPVSPRATFDARQGACRDLVVLFMDCCRSQGLPARFVSGYHGSPDPSGVHELHAWAEVLLPGVGWQGYDPSYGLLIADEHIALAAAVDPVNAGTIVGSYRGDATASMSSTLSVMTSQ